MKRHFNAKFDIEIEKEIAKLYQEGVHNGSVVLAERFKCSYGAILAALKSQGVEIRTFSSSQIGYKIGENHPSFKGGNISPDGYRRICALRLGHIKRSVVNEHTHLIEQKLGRRLTSNEIVHHINGKKLDNRIENLQLLTRAEHINLHRKDLTKA